MEDPESAGRVTQPQGGLVIEPAERREHKVQREESTARTTTSSSTFRRTERTLARFPSARFIGAVFFLAFLLSPSSPLATTANGSNAGRREQRDTHTHTL